MAGLDWLAFWHPHVLTYTGAVNLDAFVHLGGCSGDALKNFNETSNPRSIRFGLWTPAADSNIRCNGFKSVSAPKWTMKVLTRYTIADWQGPFYQTHSNHHLAGEAPHSF